MTRADIPNIITILRIGLVPPVIVALNFGQYSLALVLYFIAGVSDGLDGYLAKRYDWTSRLGSILDPLADKLLLVGTFLVLGWQGLLPVWVVAIVILRDLVILSGGVAYHFLIGNYELAPTIISKINTFFQIALGLIVVVSAAFLTLPSWVVTSLVWIVAATSILSGAHYVWSWGVRAHRNWPTRRS